jgi:hypothetical protein
MKKLLPIIVIGLIPLVLGCRADIRPESLQQRTQSRDAQQARAILKNAATSLYGTRPITPWKNITGIQVNLTDEYFGFMGWVIRPWPENPQDLVFKFIPTKDTGVLYFSEKNSDYPHAWGIHEWNAWRREPGKEAVYGDEQVKFALPTIQYFLEMPFRLSEEVEIVDYAGVIVIDNVSYHRIYATWGRYEPQEMIDQYVIYVRQDDGIIERVDFTVRDMAEFITGAIVYDDFREVNGYLLPHKLGFGSPSDPRNFFHVYTVNSYRIGITIPREEYAANPNLAPVPKY